MYKTRFSIFMLLVMVTACNRAEDAQRPNAAGRASSVVEQRAEGHVSVGETAPGTAPKATGELVEFEGTGVAIGLPGELSRVGDTSAFKVDDWGAVVVVSRGPGTVDDSVAELLEDSPRNPYRIESREPIRIGESSGMLLRGEMRNSFGDWVEAIIVLIEHRSQTTMAMAAWPEGLEDSETAKIKAAMRGLRWSPERIAEPEEGMKYVVSPAKNLKIGIVAPDPQVYVLRESGEPKPQKEGEPSMVIMQAPLPEIPPDRAAWFKLAAPSMAAGSMRSSPQVAMTTPLSIDGMEAFEASGTVINNQTGQREYFYVAIIFRGGDIIYRVNGRAPLEARETFAPQFQEVTRSLRLKKNTR